MSSISNENRFDLFDMVNLGWSELAKICILKSKCHIGRFSSILNRFEYQLLQFPEYWFVSFQYIKFAHILSADKFPNLIYPKQRTDYIFLFLLRPILRVLTFRIGIRIKTQTSIRHNFLLLVKVYPKLNKRHSVMCNEGENEIFSSLVTFRFFNLVIALKIFK